MTVARTPQNGKVRIDVRFHDKDSSAASLDILGTTVLILLGLFLNLSSVSLTECLEFKLFLLCEITLTVTRGSVQSKLHVSGFYFRLAANVLAS